MAPPDHLRVTPDQLRTAGRELLDIADHLHHNASELGGQETITAASRGFESMKVAAECEQGWQLSVEILGSKLATGADTLALNADSYANADAGQAHKFRGN